jgi:hypothetical protein
LYVSNHLDDETLWFNVAAFGLLFARTPEENNTGDNNGNADTVHVTGISLDRPTATPHTSTGSPLPRKV